MVGAGWCKKWLLPCRVHHTGSHWHLCTVQRTTCCTIPISSFSRWHWHDTSWGAYCVVFVHGATGCHRLLLAGATPSSCGSTPEGGEITVPFTAVYTCWACS